MAKYKLWGYGVQDNDDPGSSIPPTMGNRHWAEYQEWLTIEGNTPDPEFTQEDLDNQYDAAIAAADNRLIEKVGRRLAIQKAKDDGDLPNNWQDPEDNQGEQ